MDQSEILARLAKSREFEATTAKGWKFKLHLPSDFIERRIAYTTAGIAEAARPHQWMHDVLVGAVVGWSGPTLDDLLHEGDSTPLVYSAALVGPLLDMHVDVLDELSIAMHTERRARKEKAAAVEKNSGSVSAGS